jgi:hypothetical protein
MTVQYDIFKKTSNGDFVWVEAVEDITRARKCLIHLAANEPADYRLWDSARQMFVDPMEDCA